MQNEIIEVQKEIHYEKHLRAQLLRLVWMWSMAMKKNRVSPFKHFS